MCPKCRTENPDTKPFCGDCGTPLPASRNIRPDATETIQSPVKELTTGSTFAGRYQVIEELGQGGMGRVYKAFDTKIKEKIALKLIRPGLALDAEVLGRFSREMTLARRIGHRNVCRMFDLGEADGVHFLTMEYVHGEDLKSMIRMTGTLSTGAVLSIGKQIADGLAEAHSLGIVHRDLKPGNIMIDKDGSAKIMDFGIARTMREKGITGAPVMIGTPEYMSPEQAEAKEVDARADIYSLGIILYEMATGRLPFSGDTPLAVALKQMTEAPQDPSKLNAQVPKSLCLVILKCLERAKEKRYQSAGELRAELSRIDEDVPTPERAIPKGRDSKPKQPAGGERKINGKKTAIFGGAAVLLGLAIYAGLSLFTGSNEVIDSIAVLPFENVNADPNMDFLCDGIPEMIINKLSQLSNLKKVTPRNSAFSYKGKIVDAIKVGQELGVKALVLTRLVRVGDRLMISPALVRTRDNSQLWGDRYNRKIDDIFAVEEEMATSIIRELRLRISGEEKLRLTEKPTKNAAAYESYLRGLNSLWQYSNEGVTNALRHFQRAIDLEPNYAPAHAGVGLAYVWASTWMQLWPPREGVPKGKEAAQKAIELDPLLADGYAVMGFARMNYDWDWAGAEKDFARAVELSPHSVLALDGLANLLVMRSRFDEGLAVLHKALALDPLSPALYSEKGWAYWLSAKLDLAMPLFRKALEMDRNLTFTRFMLGWSYLLTDKPSEALAEFQTIEQLSPGLPWLKGSIGYLYGITGRPAEAKKALAELDQLSRKRYVTPWAQAIVYLGLGQKEIALDWLEKAYEEHDGFIGSINLDPWYGPLRNEPRFQALVKKVGINK